MEKERKHIYTIDQVVTEASKQLEEGILNDFRKIPVHEVPHDFYSPRLPREEEENRRVQSKKISKRLHIWNENMQREQKEIIK